MRAERSEEYFGLENHGDKITADGGATYLPKYADMTTEYFDDLCADIAAWLDPYPLTESDIDELRDILS